MVSVPDSASHHPRKMDHLAVIFGFGLLQISFIASIRSRISLKRVLNSVP